MSQAAIHVLISQPPGPQIMTVFEDSVSEEISKLKNGQIVGHYMTGVFGRKGHQDPYTLTAAG